VCEGRVARSNKEGRFHSLQEMMEGRFGDVPERGGSIGMRTDGPDRRTT